MEFKIAVMPGDGIGQEVIREAVRALEAVGKKYGHTFHCQYADVGGIAIDRHGTPLPEETMALAKGSDAVLFGAVGGPKWDDPKVRVRPEEGLLTLRKGLGLFANLRPIKVYPRLMEVSPIKRQVLQNTDLVVVRELTGGLYFGRPKRRWQTSKGRRGVDTMSYSEAEIERILRVGFELARSRRKRLTSVDKANILETSRLWREVAMEVAKEYPDVALDHLLVDTCAMQLIMNPSRFDVIVAENTFGDILTDEAAVLAGSMGMLPSASLAGIPSGGRALGLYEPVHGTAPDIAGRGIANPLAAILSVALMLRYSLSLAEEAQALEAAVAKAIDLGSKTADLALPGEMALGTKRMTDKVLERLEQQGTSVPT
ncbi:MAG: 3-isopropylmalate dehydrogenase [Chloroflexi bacterium]|nr:3-isopropylmalate dehydrogenase [Chloroflexota bacterium]